MTKRTLTLLLVAATLAGCDAVSSPDDQVVPATPDVSVVNGHLAFRDTTAFANFIKGAKAKGEPTLVLLNWGDEVGFRSYTHAEALADDEGVAARREGEAHVVGGHDLFFKSLLSPEGELQVGDQTLRVDSLYSTLYDKDGSVVRRALIEGEMGQSDPGVGGVQDRQSARMASAGQSVDRYYGPVDTPSSDTRNLRRFRVSASIDTDEYVIYWSVSGITAHDKLKKNFYRGWYYGDERAREISVACNADFYDNVAGNRIYSGSISDQDSETNTDWADVNITFTVNVLFRPSMDATCTHYFRNSEGYSDTITTSYSR